MMPLSLHKLIKYTRTLFYILQHLFYILIHSDETLQLMQQLTTRAMRRLLDITDDTFALADIEYKTKLEREDEVLKEEEEVKGILYEGL